MSRRSAVVCVAAGSLGFRRFPIDRPSFLGDCCIVLLRLRRGERPLLLVDGNLGCCVGTLGLDFGDILAGFVEIPLPGDTLATSSSSVACSR